MVLLLFRPFPISKCNEFLILLDAFTCTCKGDEMAILLLSQCLLHLLHCGCLMIIVRVYVHRAIKHPSTLVLIYTVYRLLTNRRCSGFTE